MLTHKESLNTLVAINLKSSFEVYMLDVKKRMMQTNLRKMMDHELLTSTRGAHVFAVDQTQHMFIVATTNHNFMCFNIHDGTLV